MKKRRTMHLVLAVAVLLLLSLTAATIYLTKDGAPLFASFKGYTSRRTLNDSPLVETKLTRIESGNHRDWEFEYVHLYDTGVSIRQGKRMEGPNVRTCKGLYSEEDGNRLSSCLTGKIDGGGEYAVAVSTEKGALSGVQGYAIIGETEFTTDIPENMLPYFVNYMGWKEYFNSMEPIDLRFKPYSLVSSNRGKT